MTTLFYLTLFLFLGLCVLLAFVVMIQENKSMGLGASFGGDSGDSLFGTSTASVLKKFTAYLAAFFMVACLMISLWTSTLGRAPTPIPQMEIEEAN